MLKKTLSILGYLFIMALLGFAIWAYFLKPKANQNPQLIAASSISTQALFATQLLDADGKLQALKQWQGKIVVLNFWATWCPPCREEMPELSAINTTYKSRNVVVIGIAIDDMEAVKAFAHNNKSDAIKVSYPLLAAEVEGMGLATGLGNDKGVLPFTLIIKADGSIAKTYFGRITKPLLDDALGKIL